MFRPIQRTSSGSMIANYRSWI